jgi:uncharacterized membrane protein
VQSEDPCEIIVQFGHDSGCPVYSLQLIISLVGVIMALIGVYVIHVKDEEKQKKMMVYINGIFFAALVFFLLFRYEMLNIFDVTSS